MKVENRQIPTNHLNILDSRFSILVEKSKTSMHSSVQLMFHGGKELVMLEIQNRFRIESVINSFNE